MNKAREQFHAMIRRVLKEELAKRDSIEERVPEQDANGLDRNKDKTKRFPSDENPIDRKSKDQLLADLTKTVGEISKDYPVVWDDHDDMKIDARDVMSIRVIPRWEEHYDVEVYTRNEDRVYVMGLDWEQVKAFVKRNLSDAVKKPTAVQKAFDKSYRNREDQTPSPDKGLPQDDKPKIKPLTTEKPSETKNKEKNYTEKAKEEQNDPMEEVKDFKKLSSYKVQDPVKPKKHRNQNSSHFAK